MTISMRNARWLRLLAYVTGSVNQELLARNEYLAAENQILRAKLPSRLRPSNSERTTLAEIAKRLGRKALREVASVAKPDTILAWYRRLIAQKFDGSKLRQYPGRPPVSAQVEALVVRMARENSGWGYDRIPGPSGVPSSRQYTRKAKCERPWLHWNRRGATPQKFPCKRAMTVTVFMSISPFWECNTFLQCKEPCKPAPVDLLRIAGLRNRRQSTKS